MFSNRRLACSSVLLLLFSCGMSGCLKFYSTPAPVAPLTFNPASAQCLGKSSNTAAALFEGRAQESDVNALFDCMRDSLTLFSQNVRGADPTAYTPDELRAFMEKYFLAGTEISDALLGEIMQVKTVLFGGTPDRITRDEITAALGLNETSRGLALQLRPWFPFTTTHFQNLSPDDLDTAVAALQAAAGTFADVLQAQGQEYRFSDLDALLASLIPVLDSPDARDALTTVRAHLTGISDAKQLLVPATADAIGGQEWAPLFSDASAGYALWLRFWNTDSRFLSFTVGDGRVAFVQWIEQGLALLDGVLARYGPNGIPLTTLDQLIEDWLSPAVTVVGWPVDLATFEATLRPLLGRVLVGNSFDSQGVRVIPAELDHATVAKAQQYLTEWTSGQAYLEAAFTAAGLGSDIAGGTAPDASGFLPAQLGPMPIPTLLGAAGTDPTSLAAAERLRELILAPETWPLFAAGDGEISFPMPLVGAGDRRHSFNDLTQLNWMNELAFILIRAYVDDPARMPPENGPLGDALYHLGAIDTEVYRFYEDFKPFGVEIKFFDPNDDTTPYDRFRDANIMTFAANGDELMDPEETQQLLAFMTSADRLAARFHNAIAQECPTGPLDIYGVITVDAECYRESLFAQRQIFFRNMPGLLSYYEKLSQDDRVTYEHEIEDAARRSGYSNGMFGEDDSQRVAAIIQYVEALFGRYDLNGDGVIDNQEAEAAFPIIESRLRQASCISKTSELHALFTYLLKNGMPPATNLRGDLSFLTWWATEKWQKIAADRMRVLQIFSQLGKQLDAAKPCPGASTTAAPGPAPGPSPIPAADH